MTQLNSTVVEMVIANSGSRVDIVYKPKELMDLYVFIAYRPRFGLLLFILFPLLSHFDFQFKLSKVFHIENVLKIIF